MTEEKKSSFFDEIVSIEEVGKIPTYDLTVPETHCFFANNILVHNSSEIEEASDLLLKCTWPRDDRMDLGLYKIDVAYNRFGPCGEVDVNFIPQFCKFTNRYYSRGDDDGNNSKDNPDSRVR